MPVIRIDFDASQLTEQDITTLSEAVQKIVADVTHIEDVMVYANNSQIKVKVHPVEIFVHMSAHKINSLDELIGQLKSRLQAWKAENGFSHLINLTLIPEPWKIEIGI